MTNVHEIRPHIDRKAAEEQQRRVTSAALREAATEVRRLAQFEERSRNAARAKPR
jgi:hypothetical protein